MFTYKFTSKWKYLLFIYSLLSSLPSLLVALTTFFVSSRVAVGDPGCSRSTCPFLSAMNTPLTVPFGDFFSPNAPISVCSGSQSKGYGSFCFVWKFVLALGESADKP